MPERLEYEVLQKARYIHTLIFTLITIILWVWACNPITTLNTKPEVVLRHRGCHLESALLCRRWPDFGEIWELDSE